jgi:UDP-N-acetylglucosamine 4,6-dehydratase
MLKSSGLVLVTGGTGFLGEKLVEILVNQGNKVRIISRNEGKLIMLKEKLPSIEIFTGDIANEFDAHQACKGVTAVYHLAAYKHVGMAEKHSLECTRSNVIGTINILNESLRNKFEFVIGISTDKAAQVAGTYGATKLLMERLFVQYETLNPDTRYRIVRYGNVLYSTGSVLCKWKEKILQGEEIVVTDPNATRFFWTREQAIDLIFQCLGEAANSSPWVPEMKAMSVGDLLTAMIQKYADSPDKIKVREIGLQKGENMHEKILESGPFSNEVERFTIEEIKELI